MTRQRNIVKLDEMSVRKYKSAIVNLGMAIRKIDEIVSIKDVLNCKKQLRLLKFYLKNAKNKLLWIKEIEEYTLRILRRLRVTKTITQEEIVAFQETLKIEQCLDGFITIVQQCQGSNIGIIHDNINRMKPKLEQFIENLNRLIAILDNSMRGLQVLPKAA